MGTASPLFQSRERGIENGPPDFSSMHHFNTLPFYEMPLKTSFCDQMHCRFKAFLLCFYYEFSETGQRSQAP